MKLTIIPLLFLGFLLCSHANAQERIDLSCRGSLTREQVESIKASKGLIRDVDTETLQDTIDGMENTKCPSLHVAMLSATSRTYADLIREYDLQDREARKTLHGKIKLNLAYMQFTAGKMQQRGTSLSRLIRKKLTEYLPREVLNHPRFLSSEVDW